jgi:sec-independent protein translocase protein TatA
MNAMFGLFNLGGGEIILILALVLILFGAKKLPELAKGLGQGIKEFKKSTREVTDEVSHSMEETPPAPQRHLPASTPATAPAPAPETPQVVVAPTSTVPQSSSGPKA